MPGYYVHLATINSKTSLNRNFILGVEVPDLLKKYYELYGIDGVMEKYNSLKTSEMPDFKRFEIRVQQPETDLNNDGMHYGLSCNPNIEYFLKTLSVKERQNPFFKGYLWHLLTDLLFYKYLDIEKKFSDFIKQHKKDRNLSKLLKLELEKLHADWDKTNAKIHSLYPNVFLTPELTELNIIKFIDDNHFNYVSLPIIKSIIDYMRSINPLDLDINKIIDEIVILLPEQNNYSVYELNKKISLRKNRN